VSEKINSLTFLKVPHNESPMLLSCNEKIIKLWKIREKIYKQ
jgi:serine/threonine-protein phosphatase 2A regulatory subunit B